MQWCVLLVYISLIGTSVITSACSQQFRSGYKRFLETVRLKDPFGVIWNIETQECKPHYDIDVDVRRYGIIENKIGDGWIGDQIALIYAPGLWPSIAANGTDINGGVPQAGNITAHLQQVNADITHRIPDVSFDGYGVIDFESWRPIWETNFDNLEPYRTKSKQIVQSAHPSWTPEQVENEAKREFEQSARRYIEGTLRLVESLRPRAKWGYYGYPYCFGIGSGNTCSNNSYAWNNRMSWVANMSTVLYPSIYFFKGETPSSRAVKASAYIEATKKWRSYAQASKTPIVVYSKISLAMPLPFYSLQDLKNSIGIASAAGVRGAILWGDHYYESNATICNMTLGYVNDVLGPYVQTILNHT